MKVKIVNKKRFIIVVSLVLLLLIATIFAVKFWNDIQNPKNLFEEQPKEKDKVYDVNEEFDKNKVNILLFGLDKDQGREEANFGVYRSDTIMLVTLDFENNSVDILSIPRDTYVPIYSRKGKDKINSCFSYASSDAKKGEDKTKKGIEYLSKTVSGVLGDIPINYYVGVTDMDVVPKVIDELGGIDIDVLHNIYTDETKKTLFLSKGQQKLNGGQLLFYARYRYYPLGDIERVANQQHIIKSLFNNLKTANSLVKLPQLFKLGSENITTNLSFAQISALSLFAMKLDMETINTHTMPGNFGDFNNISYWIIDQEKRTQLVKDLYGIEDKKMAQDATSDKLTKLTATVDTSTLQVGKATKLTISGTRANGKSSTFKINNTTYNLSQNGIVQLNADNTIVGKAPGKVTLQIKVDGVSTSVDLTVEGEKETEKEPVEETSKTPELEGVENKTIKMGENFDKKAGVKTKDNEAKWSVGEEEVNTLVPGKYKITYQVWYTSDNKTTIIRTITVEEKVDTEGETQKDE